MSEKNSKGEKNDEKRARFFLAQNWPTILTLLYVLSPIDFVPEAFVPVVGSADDAFVVMIELIRRWHLYKEKNE